MFATDLVEEMTDKSKFLDEIQVRVIAFSYDINDFGNNIVRKDQGKDGHRGMERRALLAKDDLIIKYKSRSRL